MFKILTTFLLASLTISCTISPIKNRHIATVDGHSIEFSYSKNSSPTIIFISGGGPSGISAWKKVYPRLSVKYSVFAYNRLGSGKSSKTTIPQTAKYIVSTLRKMLHKNNIRPPYILVGHSLGGMYANLYARSYPRDVSGVVLVDSSHPEQRKHFKNNNVIIGGLHRRILKAYKRINPTKYSEIETFHKSANYFKQAPNFPNVPLVVISANKKTKNENLKRIRQVMHKLHKEYAKLSLNSKHLFANKSGHNIQKQQPEIIIEAVNWVIRHQGIKRRASSKSRQIQRNVTPAMPSRSLRRPVSEPK